MKTEGSPTGNLRRCAAAPGPRRDRVVRDVPCVRRRARDRSIGRVRSESPEILLWLRRSGRIFLLLLLLLLLLRACPVSREHGHVISHIFCLGLT